jgi:alcohol dehydrogenase
MNSFTLLRVPDIFYGPGRLAELPSLLPRVTRAVLVADPALQAQGITARALELLAKAGIETKVYDGFTGEPKVKDIDAIAVLAKDATAIVGIGGGSALDAAKLAACCAVSGLSAEAYELCKTPLPKNRLRFIAIPTTAGTGSEVTRVSVYANAQKQKVWAWGDELKPDAAILDPELTTGVPAQVTAGSGLDALVHAIEAATNKLANAGNDLYCLKAISLIAANLERAVSHPRDLDARGAMLLGSCYAGIGIDNGGTGLSHNISHALADIAPIPHGRATGLAMLATMDWVMEGNPEGYGRVAAAMGADDPVRAYDSLVRATGIKVNLAGDGLDLGKPELLAEHMALPANAPMRNGIHRYASDADLLMLAERFYALS